MNKEESYPKCVEIISKELRKQYRRIFKVSDPEVVAKVLGKGESRKANFKLLSLLEEETDSKLKKEEERKGKKHEEVVKIVFKTQKVRNEKPQLLSGFP